MFKKILIANRGEIALRIQRACKALHIKTVAIYSPTDKDLMHVKLADEAICIGPNSPQESYLNIPAIISAAEISGVDAIHPGYGFLAENSDFAKQVSNSGFVFIGPKDSLISQMGDKISAIKTMRELNVPCISGTGLLSSHQKSNASFAQKIGYPVLIKASAGGGGRGMNVVHVPEELHPTIKLTKSQAKATFGSSDVYMEKYLETPRHIEIQVIADHHGNAVYFPERDCSMQRRNQKIIEESPGVDISEKERQYIGKICLNAVIKMGYTNAGTFEFLYENGQFFFIEMNTRIQVEHPITEMVSQFDLVKEQICIAANQPLSIQQKSIGISGHAIECRINAENPTTFLPSPGKITQLVFPGGPGIRVDSHLYPQYTIPHYFDPMIAKIIAHGKTRQEAIQKAIIALQETIIEGPQTNIPTHLEILQNPDFIDGEFNIHSLEAMLTEKHMEPA
ncbi:MAG TPA: acetyl-CoA carboxylase biotin carboxylase subunit [Gammaproteobacteria bacterium]|nr:acetyl-CoA carboxylase biotin carboxylase subunit [Gammaproteobacteria bacterium]